MIKTRAFLYIVYCLMKCALPVPLYFHYAQPRYLHFHPAAFIQSNDDYFPGHIVHYPGYQQPLRLPYPQQENYVIQAPTAVRPMTPYNVQAQPQPPIPVNPQTQLPAQQVMSPAGRAFMPTNLRNHLQPYMQTYMQPFWQQFHSRFPFLQQQQQQQSQQPSGQNPASSANTARLFPQQGNANYAQITQPQGFQAHLNPQSPRTFVQTQPRLPNSMELVNQQVPNNPPGSNKQSPSQQQQKQSQEKVGVPAGHNIVLSMP